MPNPSALFQSSASTTFVQHLIGLTTLSHLDSILSFRLQNINIILVLILTLTVPSLTLMLATLPPPAPQILSLSPFVLFCLISILFSLIIVSIATASYTPKFWRYK